MAADRAADRVDVQSVRRAMEPELIKMPGVTGVSHHESAAKMIVYVKTRQDAEAVPRSLGGVRVQVRVTGPIRILSQMLSVPRARVPRARVPRTIRPMSLVGILATRTDRWRPAPGGVSVGNPAISAGTLGTLTVDGAKIVSNYHVFAMGIGMGGPILQPGPFDLGGATDRIASLSAYGEIVPEQSGQNLVDAAAASPDDPSLVTNDILGAGPVEGWTDASEGMGVYKSGRTTGLRYSSVIDVNATVKVEGYDVGVAIFKDQVVIDNGASYGFGAGGDSGSLVFCEMAGYRLATGLLFAGSPQIIVANKIRHVRAELGLDLGPYVEWTPPPTETVLAGMLPVGMMLGLVGWNEFVPKQI